MELSTEIVFVLGHGAFGDSTCTVHSGTYVPYASDRGGVYLRHKEKGLTISGNFGIPSGGGLYFPDDADQPLGIWLAPNRSAAIGIWGPAGAALVHDDQVNYFAHVPSDASAKIREAMTKRTDGEPGATDNPGDAQRLREDH